MNVFVTGGTGFIGPKVVQILLAHGHKVTGLTRSDQSANRLLDLGASVVRGSLTDLTTIATAAKNSDGVIHLAFTNDFDDYDGAVAKDEATVKAIGDALIGSNKPFVNTSGTLTASNLGHVATENDHAEIPTSRGKSEALALSYAKQAVRATTVRLSPTVHNEQRQGFGTVLSQMAIMHEKTGYLGNGDNVWPSVHRDDAAALFVAALENGKAGAIYNAVAEEGIAVKTIIATIGNILDIPVVHFDATEAPQYLGWFADTTRLDNPTSSALTQQELDWHPTHTGLLADMTAFLSNPANVTALKQG